MEPDQVDKLSIQSIDHIVMQAIDVPETIKFYTEILGMAHSEFGWTFMISISSLVIVLISFSVILGKPKLEEKR